MRNPTITPKWTSLDLCKKVGSKQVFKMTDQTLDDWLCIVYNGGVLKFPCNAGPFEAVSAGLVAGGLALLFAGSLTTKVRC